jgi:hypothetical protein
MSGVNAQIDLNIVARLVGAADLGNPQAPVTVQKSLTIKPGTDALGKADILWADQRTLAASGSEDLDLAGVLASLLGGTITAAEITAIYIEADSGNTNDVQFFGAASNGFNGPLSGTTPKLAMGPGDWSILTNLKGWAVTASTGDLLHVANGGSGTGVTYKIAIIGRTVAA